MLLVGVAMAWPNKSRVASLILITAWQGWMQTTTAVYTLTIGEVAPLPIRAGAQDNINA